MILLLRGGKSHCKQSRCPDVCNTICSK